MKWLFLAVCFVGLAYANNTKAPQPTLDDSQYIEVEVTEEPILQEDSLTQEEVIEQSIQEINAEPQIEEERLKIKIINQEEKKGK